MFAIFAIFEHLSSVRRLLNRLNFFSSTSSTKFNEEIILDSTEDQHNNILLRPILNNILIDKRLNYFNDELRQDLEKQDYFAQELDACLLEMKDIERDLYNLKQRQCHYYERYLDFIDKKDELIEEFLKYHDEYFINKSKEPRRQSINYEFNIPVSNRFELLKRQHT